MPGIYLILKAATVYMVGNQVKRLFSRQVVDNLGFYGSCYSITVYNAVGKQQL